MATPAESFRRFTPFTVTLTALTFALIVVGATTRAVGAGLSCPDWPLCNGKLIPTFEGGVFFEWFHRLIAGSVSMLFMGLVVWALVDRNLRARLWGVMTFAVGMLIVQIVLGGLTVLDLLKPYIVTLHLSTGSLLFGAFNLVMWRTLAVSRSLSPAESQPRGLKPLGAFALGLTYLQIVLGGLVASNYAAWACPDWPKCHGMWLPPMVGLVGIHMTHRFIAYLVLIVVTALAIVARKSPDLRIRVGAGIAGVLVWLQVALGVLNVLNGIPVPLTAAHNGCGEALFATLIAVTFALFAGVPAGDGPDSLPTLREAVAR